MFELALRNLLGRKLRTGMTFGAVCFGVMSLVLSGGFIEDMFIQLREAVIHSQFGHIQVNAQGFFEKGARAPDRFMLEDPEPLKAKIAGLPGVVDVMARVSFSGLLSNGRSDRSIIGEGIEPDREAKLGTFIRMESGRALTKMNELIDAQGRQTTQHRPGALQFEVKAERNGVVAAIDNFQLARIARLAGAPMDKGAGVDLLKKLGDPVTEGEALYRVHSEVRADFDFARNLSQRARGYSIEDSYDAGAPFAAES